MSRMGLRKAFAPGANPSFTTVVRVADALGLSLELLAA
jgi:DNA-binding phage protein